MSREKLRTRLFGYKKSDVLDYINKLDINAEAQLKEKTDENKRLVKEIEGMKNELAEARAHRDAIVSVLEIAQKKADEIMSDAREAARQIEENAAKYAEDEKNSINREIEIKKREIDNKLIGESKKIAALRKEIEELRQSSLKSIKRFEKELGSIEGLLGKKEEETKKELNSASDKGSNGFFDSIRTVPIKIVRTSSDA